MDSHFFQNPAGFGEANYSLYRLVGYPGSYHSRARNFNFADGHAEPCKWRDPHTTPRLVRDHTIPRPVEGISYPGNPDVRWIQDRTSQRGE